MTVTVQSGASFACTSIIMLVKPLYIPSKPLRIDHQNSPIMQGLAMGAHLVTIIE